MKPRFELLPNYGGDAYTFLTHAGNWDVWVAPEKYDLFYMAVRSDGLRLMLDVYSDGHVDVTYRSGRSVDHYLRIELAEAVEFCHNHYSLRT